MTFTLMPLPYSYDSLEPHIKTKTVEVHYKQHHSKYVDKLNAAIDDTSMKDYSLKEIILHSYGNDKLVGVYNNAAQIANHDMYWLSMSAEPTEPSNRLQYLIENSEYLSVDSLLGALIDVGMAQFGSGWAWVVLNSSQQIRIEKTSNADNPIVYGSIPLLCLDVWEHAYYLDFMSDRNNYCKSFAKIINWSFADKMMKNGWYS